MGDILLANENTSDTGVRLVKKSKKRAQQPT